jgi:acyl dehydratase
MTSTTIPLGFTYDTIAVGQTARSPGRTVTDTDHSLFMMLTGGWHPIHSDETAARAAGARGRIVQGTFGIALALGGHLESALLESRDPLVAAIGLLEWTYKAPIHIGDTLHVEIEIVAVRLTSKGDRYIVDRRVSLRNQDDIVVQTGVARSMWARQA